MHQFQLDFVWYRRVWILSRKIHNVWIKTSRVFTNCYFFVVVARLSRTLHPGETNLSRIRAPACQRRPIWAGQCQGEPESGQETSPDIQGILEPCIWYEASNGWKVKVIEVTNSTFSLALQTPPESPRERQDTITCFSRHTGALFLVRGFQCTWDKGFRRN